jgi:hypothetical protein
MERIPADGWHQHAGHVARYAYAAQKIRNGDVVNDVACGSGYGATFLRHTAYRGYDRAGVPDPSFAPPGAFHVADLNDPLWLPQAAHVTLCFETIEHVQDPEKLAAIICETTEHSVIVSAPIVPTKHLNPYHLHDFTREDIPPLFSGLVVVDEWAQPEELSHVWLLSRSHYA